MTEKQGSAGLLKLCKLLGVLLDIMYKHSACGISMPTTIAAGADQKFGGRIDN